MFFLDQNTSFVICKKKKKKDFSVNMGFKTLEILMNSDEFLYSFLHFN